MMNKKQFKYEKENWKFKKIYNLHEYQFKISRKLSIIDDSNKTFFVYHDNHLKIYIIYNKTTIEHTLNIYFILNN